MAHIPNFIHYFHKLPQPTLFLFIPSYLAIRNPVEAARVLTKRSDQSALTSAIDILLTANELETAKVYGQKLIQKCLHACDWLTAATTIQSHACFKVKAKYFALEVV